MTQTATVRRIVSARKAEVAVLRETACGHDCASCGGCKSGERPEVLALAENAAGAVPGDTVLVESASSRVLGIAAVVYLVPFLLFFGGYFLAGAMGQPDTASIVWGVAGIVLGAVVDLLLNRRLRRERKTALRIVSIRPGENACSDM